MEDLGNLTVEQLKTELHKMGLKATGRKEQLISRLQAAVNNTEANDSDSSYKGDDNRHGSGAQEQEKQVLVDENDPVSRLAALLESKLASPNLISNGFAVKDLENSITKFSGDNDFKIEHWIREFEEVASLMKWNEVEKFIYAKKQLVGTAKLFIRTCCCSSYEGLKLSLIKEFHKTICKADIYMKLQKRLKRTDENFRQYMYRMKEIADQADVDTSSLIQYIINGITDKEENKLILYGAKTLDELKDKWEIYEKVKSRLGKRNYSDRFDVSKRIYPKTSTNNDHCFNCGSKEHKRRDCTAETKCFKCNRNGHMSLNCSNNSGRHNNSGAGINIISTFKMQKSIVINGTLTVDALIDTGSDVTLLREDVFNTIRNRKLTQNSLNLIGLESRKCKTLGSFNTFIEVDGIRIQACIHVVQNNTIRAACIIGNDLISKTKLVIDGKGITFYKYEEENIMQIQVEQLNDLDVSGKYAEEVKTLVREYKPTTIQEAPMKMQIVLTDETPIYCPPRRIPLLEQKIVKSQIQEWLETGIIRPSTSPFASRVVVVKKKDGTSRICIDYRRLNQKMIKEHFPVPLIEELLDKLQDAKIFSTLDLKNGYFHVPIENNSRKYTAFSTVEGHFEFNRVPFGLCNSPAIFLRYIHSIFRSLVSENVVLTYMDDLIIPAKNEEENLQKLRTVLQVASQNGLQIKWSKCSFLKRQVDFLGHIVGNGTIRPSKTKIKAVSNFPEPKNIKDLQAFLGLTGYFRRFVAEYSIKARPLTDLLKKNVQFKLDPVHRKAIQSLKISLTEDPVLHIFRQNATTELHTDASKIGCAAIMLQKDDDGNLHPVYYSSHKNTPTEEQLHSYVLEVKAVYLALKKFRVYLLGLKFSVVTDCAAFTQTVKRNDLPTAVARWILYMQDFDFEVKHRGAKRMKHVDGLSRYPLVYYIENELLARIRKAQQLDEYISAIKLILKDHEYENFLIKGNLLFKVVEGKELLVAPRNMEKELIKLKHNEGHFAVKKTMHLITQEFFIPKIEQKVKNCIENCIPCILAARKTGKQEGFLHPLDKDHQPLVTYHIDHIGPMESTSKSYKYIFTVVDGFSKYVWIYPTKTLGAEEVVKKLKEQQQYFGNPRRIISDRGGAFISECFKKYCAEENIEHILITAGVPRGNGQAERLNQVIIDVLKRLSAECPDKWYRFVSRVQTSINSTFQRAIQRTPFEVLFGTPMKKKDDLQIAELIHEENLKIFDEERDKTRYDVRKQIEKIQGENRKAFDKRRKPDEIYHVGDLVAIKKTQFSPGNKIAGIFLGPYEIIRKGRAGRYTVKKIGSCEGPKQTTTCSDHMKPWRGERKPEETDSEAESLQDGRM